MVEDDPDVLQLLDETNKEWIKAWRVPLKHG